MMSMCGSRFVQLQCRDPGLRVGESLVVDDAYVQVQVGVVTWWS